MSRRRGSGEGSIYRTQDGRWRGEISLGYKPDGKPRRRILYGHTRLEVSEDMKKVLREQQVGLEVASGKQTVAGHLRYWLDEVAKNEITPQTYRSYDWIVRTHLVPHLGRTQLDKLTPTQVQKFLNERHEGGLSAGTVKHIRATLRSALSCAQDAQAVYTNVAKLVSLPRGPKYKPTVLTPEKARELLKATDQHRYAVIFRLALSLGLRRGEVLALRWSDVDLNSREIRIERSIGRVKGEGLVAGSTKSETSRRKLTLPKVCVTALRKQQATQEKLRQWAGETWSENDLVFSNEAGKPIAPEAVTHEFSQALEDAKLPHMRLHDLRHCCASILIAQGVHMKAIQATLGHSSFQLTMDTYSHLLPQTRNDVATKMDRALSTPTKSPTIRRRYATSSNT